MAFAICNNFTPEVRNRLMQAPIILLVDDLLFGPHLENQVRHSGYVPITVNDEVSLNRSMVKAPVLVIVDLSATTFDWRRLVRSIRGPGKKNEHVPVLGFGPHVDLALREDALTQGCTAVVGRAAIRQDLPRLVEKHIWRLDETLCAQPRPAVVDQALETFNRGQYFEAHELLELAWNDTTTPLRTLYQGILQIGVGFHHIQHQNWRGAMKVLERGIPKAAHFQPTCQGIDVAALVQAAQAVRAEIADLGPENLDAFDLHSFPKIQYH